jgi:hypothetical protein
MAPQTRGGQELRKTNQKNGSQRPTKFLVCCFVAIRVPGLFVELQVMFL